ncbi:hypothetical protein KDR40_004790 [Salmonella enterica subsp. enterica serovar Saintpaul]|nr:hypothetical protein [Salmonella enterica subsp. enterica serovar Saintpaul]
MLLARALQESTDDDAAGPGIWICLTTGITLLAHSAGLKILIFTMQEPVVSLSLWVCRVWVTLAAEIISGTMLTFDVKPEPGVLIVIPGMSGAVWAHSGNNWLFSKVNGGQQYPLFWTGAPEAQALPGGREVYSAPDFQPTLKARAVAATEQCRGLTAVGCLTYDSLHMYPASARVPEFFDRLTEATG